MCLQRGRQIAGKIGFLTALWWSFEIQSLTGNQLLLISRSMGNATAQKGPTETRSTETNEEEGNSPSKNRPLFSQEQLNAAYLSCPKRTKVSYLFIIFGLVNLVSLYAVFQTPDDIELSRIWLLLMGIATVSFLLGASYVIHCEG
jgi:hypothetical protein